MPCPFFEPLRPADTPRYVDARLPLVQEYEGACHATDPVATSPSELQFRCCNHGYSRGECGRFPVNAPLSALRYHVVRRTVDSLELLCIEEVEHRPGRRFRFSYDVNEASLAPAGADRLIRAQAAAFCRSYLLRFCATTLTD